MSLEFKQQLRQVQTQTITLQLQQAIKLLALNQLELADVVQQELVENPVLELAEAEAPKARDELPAESTPHDLADPPRLEDAPSTNDIVEDIDWSAYLADRHERGRTANTSEGHGDDLPGYDQVLTRSETLSEHLLWQLAMADLEPVQRWAAEQIIGNLDDDGFLAAALDELANESVPVEVFEEVLPIVQQLDPVGVGSRNLQECLQAQARALFPDAADLHLLLSGSYFDIIFKRDPMAFSRAAGIPIERATAALRLVEQLDPKPGSAYSDESPRYITPDVYVFKVGDDYEVQLNDDGLPRLRVSNYYRDVLKEMAGKERDYVKERLRSATWLIRSIYQRKDTIYKVVRAIVHRQREFFDLGVERMRPMVLRDVADEIGMHESTVSRVTSNKYLHCAQGTFPLKFFFNSGVNTSSGGDIASEAVKSRIKHLMDNEDPRHPLSDQTLVEMLEGEGIEVARRTVAKYRDALGYLPSSKRKRMF